MIWALPEDLLVFPHPLTAGPDGPIAVGGRLQPENILLAYRFGIFPWFSPGDPIVWWYTNPRSVLMPHKVKISKSMRQVLRKPQWQITINNAFSQVIKACQNVYRPGQDNTWIQPDIIDAFTALHHMGYAHSVEIWADKELVGGVYGLAIGRVFYGESMFTKRSNASKVALIHLCQHLEKKGFVLIDCQQETDHLNSMGAQLMSSMEFFGHLRQNILFSLQHGDLHF